MYAMENNIYLKFIDYRGYTQVFRVSKIQHIQMIINPPKEFSVDNKNLEISWTNI